MSELAQTKASPAIRGGCRVSERFRELVARGEVGVVAFLVVGDPSLEASEKILLAAAEGGADVIELGVPFSDPIADGPIIQRASERALRSGTTLAGILEVVRRVRARSEVPLVLFSYFNPVLQMGLERFAAAAQKAGADGVLVTDLTPEEGSEYRATMHAHGLDTIYLGAPTSTGVRLQQIAESSTGFLYLISRTGVTGAREALPEDLPELVRRARHFTKLPIAVGFGISLPTHVSVLGGIADAAVVGSALVAEVEKAASPKVAAAAVEEKIRILKRAGREGVSRRGMGPE